MRWWLLESGCTDDTEPKNHLVHRACCDSTTVIGITPRKGSTRKARHIELEAFF